MASATKSWEFDEFDDGALRKLLVARLKPDLWTNVLLVPSLYPGCGWPERIGAVQLDKYQKFLEDYAKQLLDIEDALDEHLGDGWDLSMDPIALHPDGQEQASIMDLIKTDNKVSCLLSTAWC